MRLYSLLTTCLLLSACASNVQSYAKIDQNAKTIMVPSGSKGLKGDIKKALSERGWKLVVTPGADIIEGHAGENIYLQKYNKFGTRYTLTGNERRLDYCFNFSPFISYEIVMVDNSNGTEVFTLDGKECQDEVVRQFIAVIENKPTAKQ